MTSPRGERLFLRQAGLLSVQGQTWSLLLALTHSWNSPGPASSWPESHQTSRNCPWRSPAYMNSVPHLPPFSLRPFSAGVLGRKEAERETKQKNSQGATVALPPRSDSLWNSLSFIQKNTWMGLCMEKSSPQVKQNQVVLHNKVRMLAFQRSVQERRWVCGGGRNLEKQVMGLTGRGQLGSNEGKGLFKTRTFNIPP